LFLDVARSHGWDVRGIEPSKWAVELGREQFAVPLEQATVEEWQSEPESADLVVMLDVLEHVADPRLALEKIRTALHPEGLLILSTVNLSGIHARIARGAWPWFIRSHVHYFSEDSLMALLRRTRFDPIEWSLVPRSFHLSYIAGRERDRYPRLARAATEIARTFDPKVRLGWLGDITFVAARPALD
jgi:SAM-dependent methyltransferase